MTTDTLTKRAPRASAGRRRSPRRKIDAAMRQRIEEAITRMIDALDALDAPGEDLEDDDPGGGDDEREGDGEAEDEPSLGAPEHFNLDWAWSLGFGARDDTEIELGSPGVTSPNDQTYREAAFGDRDGREDENEHADGDNGGCVDDEPSLGSLENRISQKRWALPDRGWRYKLLAGSDHEQDEAEQEGDVEDGEEDGEQGQTTL